jgi:hypothetical protein
LSLPSLIVHPDLEAPGELLADEIGALFGSSRIRFVAYEIRISQRQLSILVSTKISNIYMK